MMKTKKYLFLGPSHRLTVSPPYHQISYNAAQFSKMARTGLPKDCKRLLNSSKLPLLQRMFPDGAPTEWMKGRFHLKLVNLCCILISCIQNISPVLKFSQANIPNQKFPQTFQGFLVNF